MEIKNSRFFSEAKLMVQSLPYIFEEKNFALKGGSAINFFFRDMPRLSVDIDLTYLPIEPREESLKNIETALQRIAQNIEKRLANVKVQEAFEWKLINIQKINDAKRGELLRKLHNALE